ncbi:MAG: hypothetical protein RBQ97_04085 [Acholeplasma sp.]|nr:hypothetical protein [Acholeplasma sp.]
MKLLRFIKKSIRITLMIVLFGISYSFFFSTYENIKVNAMISNFKNRATQSSELISQSNAKYYRRYWIVPRETSEQDGLNVFNDSEKKELGRRGDIFVTRQSPFKNVLGLHQFMTYYFGGHAALLDYENGTPVFYESTGFPDDFNEFIDVLLSNGEKGHGLGTTAGKRSGNYWFNHSTSEDYYNLFYRSKFVGLRVKNPYLADGNLQVTYDDIVENALKMAREKYKNEALYNFLFFLDTKNKYYCTDFVSRSYEEAFLNVINNDDTYRSRGYANNLNDDGFITSVNDLILSEDTYIHFYVEIKEEKDPNTDEKIIVQNIYYLEDVSEDSI